MGTGEKAYLILADGTLFEGKPMGARGKAVGTVVCSTSMVGYQEALTDPANYGLLLAQTFPLIGNYGINSDGWISPDHKAKAAGYIVRECCKEPSNFKCEGTLDAFLMENGVVGICDIDTRHLMKYIRENGEMPGVILSEGTFDKAKLLAELSAWKPENRLDVTDLIGGAAGTAEMETGKEAPSIRIAMLGFGDSTGLVRQGAEVRMFPYTAELSQIEASAPDGILLWDGPGDPAAFSGAVELVKQLCKLNIPVFGVSLGHQLLALAHGLGTRQMKCGHRGANQPVLSLLTGRTYITSQNHGFVVDETSLDNSVCELTFENANDHTVEGLLYRDGPCFGVQFLPDSAPGRQSTLFLYEEFIQMITDQKGKVD